MQTLVSGTQGGSQRIERYWKPLRMATSCLKTTQAS